jgi:hypothetical protein
MKRRHLTVDEGKVYRPYNNVFASPTPNAVKYWYKKFRAGCESIEDEARSRRPRIVVDVDAIRAIFASYPFASARYIAE